MGQCILYLNTFLMRNMCIVPDDLSDEEWAWTIRYLTDIMKLESKGNDRHS